MASSVDLLVLKAHWGPRQAGMLFLMSSGWGLRCLALKRIFWHKLKIIFMVSLVYNHIKLRVVVFALHHNKPLISTEGADAIIIQ